MGAGHAVAASNVECGVRFRTSTGLLNECSRLVSGLAWSHDSPLTFAFYSSSLRQERLGKNTQVPRRFGYLRILAMRSELNAGSGIRCYFTVNSLRLSQVPSVYAPFISLQKFRCFFSLLNSLLSFRSVN